MIKATCDRKTRFYNSQHNTFGLYPGTTKEGTCPHATLGEGGCCQINPGRKLPTCYVFSTIAAYKGVGPVLLHNTNMLRVSTKPQKVQLLTQEFARFQAKELKRSEPKLYYRIHWSGDVYDAEYGGALAESMLAFPNITFWNYTRSLHLAVGLANAVPNLIQFLSLDAINLEAGLVVYFEYKTSKQNKHDNLHISYMADADDFNRRYTEYRARHKTWPEQPPVLTSCPVDEGKLKLDGACAKCRKCLNGYNIWFKTK